MHQYQCNCAKWLMVVEVDDEERKKKKLEGLKMFCAFESGSVQRHTANERPRGQMSAVWDGCGRAGQQLAR